MLGLAGLALLDARMAFTGSSSLHIFVRVEPVIRLELLLRLQQSGADIVELGVLQVGLGHGRRPRSALTDFGKAGGQQLLVDRREALLQQREYLGRAVE